MPWRRRQVTEEHAVPPPRPLIWPWLVLLLLLVAGGIAAAYYLSRDDGETTRVPDVVGLRVSSAVRELGERGYTADIQARVSSNRTAPGRVLSQAPAAGTELDRGESVTVVVARGPGRTEVPRVVGLSVAQALVRVQEADLKGRTARVASRQPKDRVLRQVPAPGRDVRKDSTVTLTVSNGPRAVPVPSVIGSTQSSATSDLRRAGFKVAAKEIQASEPRGTVVTQTPAPATRAARGSVVTISVSSGPATTTGPTTTQPPSGRAIPNVVGLSQRDAVARLQSAGFRVDSYPADSSRPRGTVISQRPEGGKRASPSSRIRIDVSLGSGERPLRTIPDVIGRTENEAKQMLVELGFTVRSVDRPAADSSQRGAVLAQEPAAGGRASAGSQIVLSIGQ